MRMPRVIKTPLVVVLLTGLIWAWAEHTQTRTLDKQSFELEISLAPGSGFALFHDAGPARWSQSIRLKVTADFIGQQGGITRLSQMIDGGEYPPVHALRLSDHIRPQELEAGAPIDLDLAKLLNSQPELDRLHVVVTSVTPATARIRIEPLKQYSLAVRPRFPDGIARPATASPPDVKLTLPAALYESLKDKEILADVRINPAELTQPRVAKATIAREIGGYPVQPYPAEATVTIPVDTKIHTVDNVWVMPRFCFGFPWQDYELVSEKHQWRKTIHARGPADRTLTPADVELALNFDLADKEPAEELRRDFVVNRLPEGFTLTAPMPGDPDRQIKFKFVKREERPIP